eukprot:TRINITY_DN9848_c0_g1_i1.p1 TRINITY_DN9848_c0_g1~~TRINITY_DN9848_c0_g1_i1.p1  ORF type:complete len:315 (+),score=75.94 TRINITY_DN9848_c0_g1_i1:330-1274(+)
MSLTDDQVSHFLEEGYLLIPQFFEQEELTPVMDEISETVGEVAQALFEAGKIDDLFSDAGFYERLTLLEDAWPGASVLVHTQGIMKPKLAALWSNSRLLDIIEQILGKDVAGHPVWNLRTKTPGNVLAKVPWHQDTAYFAPGAEETLTPTAWIPFCDATFDKGCMQVLKGGHRSGLKRHRLVNTVGDKRSWQLFIDEDDLPDGEVVTCEVPMGGLLLINQIIPHRSVENTSNQIRWSVDLRWVRTNETSGFEHVKETIIMRKSDDPDHKIDFTEWAKKNRHEEESEHQKTDPFDIKVTGPWMTRWSIQSETTES